MAILITFCPWIVFWIFLSMKRVEYAFVLGLACAVAVVSLSIIRRQSLKILQLGTLAFFIIGSFALLFVNQRTLGHWGNFLGSFTLLLVALFSMLIKQPFTLGYARDSVPKELWHDPGFIHTNYVLTSCWAAAFFVSSCFGLANMKLHEPLWLTWTVTLVVFGTAFAITHLYTLKVRKRRASTQQAPAEAS
jgi:all-trans-retinol 13,14-reductase